MCPHCGALLAVRPYFGFEYRSSRTLWGWPVVHMAFGFDAATGRPMVARGVIAVGTLAVGLVSVGSAAAGVFTVAGFGAGLFTFGGVSLALVVAIGGIAAAPLAAGGIAVGVVAVGGLAVGLHALGGNTQDPTLLEFFHRILRIPSS